MSGEQTPGPQKPSTEYIRTPEEKEISDLLVELQSYMPPLVIIIPLVHQLTDGTPIAIRTWVRPFTGDPQKIEWLRSFVLDAKYNMEALLPEGVGMDVFTEKNMPSSKRGFNKWELFQNSYPANSNQ